MEDRFCQSALEQGWITQARLEECKIIQKEMGNMGIQEKIWNVFMDKKYMSMDQCQEILRQLDDAPMGQTATGAHEIPQAPTPSAENTQLPGYEMAGLLGKGAMGSVYKAVQLSLNRTVAIKILLPTLPPSPVESNA